MADNNKVGTTKDHSNSGIRRFSAKESNQDYGEIGTGHSLKGVSKNGRGKTDTKHKEAKHSHKNRNSRLSVTIEVLLRTCRQKNHHPFLKP